MLALVVFAMMLGQSPVPQNTSAAPSITTTPEQDPTLDKARQLVKVRRVYVESFGNDAIAQKLQAMVITSLTDSNRFVVTEEKSKADAILKGSASEKASEELHAYGSSTAVATAHGGSHVSGSSHYFSGDAGFSSAKGAIDDSSVNTETVERASASVRLVNIDGDVIWTTTQESKGAKFKGASADVADKIVRQLTRDVDKANKALTPTTGQK